MTVRAHVLFQKLLDALHALLVLDLGKGIFHGIDGVKVGKVQLSRLIGVFGVVENVLLLRRAMVDDVLFPLRQVAKRHVRAHAHLPADVRHQRPHETVPRRHRPIVDRERIIRHQRRHVHRAHTARAAASWARALRVEGQLLGARCVKMHAALRAGQLLPRGDQQRRRQVVPVGAAVAGEAGVHEPQAVQELRPRAERAADAGHAGALVQRQRRRNVQHVIDCRAGGLRHPAARVGRQRLQIAARALGVQHTQRQRRLAGTGHARDADDLIQRNVHVNIFQVVDLCSAYKHMIDHGSCILHLELAQRPDGYAFIPCDLLYLAARQAVDKRNMGTVNYFENCIHS